MDQQKMSADEAATAAAEARFGKSGAAGGMPTSQMGAEGGLSGKAPGKPMSKAEVEEYEKLKKMKMEEDEKKACAKKSNGEEGPEKEDEDEDKDEAEEEAEAEAAAEKAKKGDTISSDDLMKAMDALEATAEGIDGTPDRRAELAEKIADGTISKAERAELFELLGGAEDPYAFEGEGEYGEEEPVAKSFQDVFAQDEQLSGDYEVAPFIERQSQLTAEALDAMREGLAKSTGEQQVFNRALAKSFKGIGQVISEQGDMIKSLADQNAALAERLGMVETAPLPRKGMTGASPLKKSFSGGDPGAGGLSKSEITDGLNRLMVKSKANNWMAPCGEPVDRAVTLYETESKITRGMLGDVASELGKTLQLQ